MPAGAINIKKHLLLFITVSVSILKYQYGIREGNDAYSVPDVTKIAFHHIMSTYPTTDMMRVQM